jgi:pimeloyl-ACP methyl ester carboxylesterase
LFQRGYRLIKRHDHHAETLAMQIILIPGLMNDGWVWRHQIGPLSRIAPVMIACNEGCDSLAAMASRILAATSGPLALVGHSMGGRVALEAVAQAPGRVKCLALLDTGAGGPVEAEAAGRKRLVDLARAEGMAAVAREWLPPMLSALHRADQNLVRGISGMIERCTPEIFAGQQHALIERPDRTALLPEIACPTLAAAGSDDEWAPFAQHQAMAAAIRGGTARIIPGAGHMTPVEAPEAVTAMLAEWLGSAP